MTVDREPSWPSGVIAACAECYEIGVLRPVEWDYLDEPTVEICRSCYYGWNDDD